MSNQDKIDSNRNRPRQPGVPGAVRHGQTLLQGIALCGRCGYPMTVQQGGQNLPRYVCNALLQHGRSTKACWSVSARAIDQAVTELFLGAAQPPEVELSLAVTREVERQASELEQHWKLRFERARYEASLAERRYMAVDPDNRVVARTLENDWEAKLRELERLEQAYAEARRAKKVELSDEDRRQILALSRDLPRVWSAETTTHQQRKQLIRLLVEQVALTPVEVPRRQTRIEVLWQTGETTARLVERPRYRPGRLAPAESVEQIRQRVAANWTDRAIAEELNERGLPSATGRPWTKQTVRSVRKRRGIRKPYSVEPGGRIPKARPDGLVSVRGVAERFAVDERKVRRWVYAGRLTPVEGGGEGRRPMWFRLDAETERRLSALAGKGKHPKR